MRFLKYQIPDNLLDSLLSTLDNIVHVDVHYAILPKTNDISTPVDILWDKIDELPDFTHYRVYPEPNGLHEFGGLGYLYEIEYQIYLANQ